MLSLLSGMNKVNEGEVFLYDKNIRNISYREMAKNIAMVHQQNEVPLDLTVIDLISFGRMPYKKPFEPYNDEDEELVQWAMDITGVTPYRDNRVMELSGGERQRVFIAMALAQNTEIIFLDEPTTYLDIYHQIQILDIIKDLNRKQNKTVIMVLHDINQAVQYSDNIIIMKNGEKVIAGDSKNIINSNIIEEVYGIRGIMFKETRDYPNYFIPISNAY